MDAITSAGAVRPAITTALFVQPGIVVVAARSEREFVETVFPDLTPATPLHARTDHLSGRPGAGHWSTFDTYRELVHPNYPLLAVMPNHGRGPIESAVLDEDLLAYYAHHAPTPETADQVETILTNLTLLQPDSLVDTSELRPGVGAVIPQVRGIPPVVYRIRPVAAYGAESVLETVTFVVPNGDRHSVETLRRLGFAPWGQSSGGGCEARSTSAWSNHAAPGRHG